MLTFNACSDLGSTYNALFTFPFSVTGGNSPYLIELLPDFNTIPSNYSPILNPITGVFTCTPLSTSVTTARVGASDSVAVAFAQTITNKNVIAAKVSTSAYGNKTTSTQILWYAVSNADNTGYDGVGPYELHAYNIATQAEITFWDNTTHHAFNSKILFIEPGDSRVDTSCFVVFDRDTITNDYTLMTFDHESPYTWAWQALTNTGTPVATVRSSYLNDWQMVAIVFNGPASVVTLPSSLGATTETAIPAVATIKACEFAFNPNTWDLDVVILDSSNDIFEFDIWSNTLSAAIPTGITFSSIYPTHGICRYKSDESEVFIANYTEKSIYKFDLSTGSISSYIGSLSFSPISLFYDGYELYIYGSGIVSVYHAGPVPVHRYDYVISNTSISNEVINEGAGSYLLHSKIEPGSVTFSWNTSGGPKSVTDDGSGNISSVDWSPSSTIDYVTGNISTPHPLDLTPGSLRASYTYNFETFSGFVDVNNGKRFLIGTGNINLYSSASAYLDFTLLAGSVTFDVDSASQNLLTKDIANTVTINVTGGTSTPFSLSTLSGTPPTGMNLSTNTTSTLTLSGTPTVLEEKAVTAKLTEDNSTKTLWASGQDGVGNGFLTEINPTSLVDSTQHNITFLTPFGQVFLNQDQHLWVKYNTYDPTINVVSSLTDYVTDGADRPLVSSKAIIVGNEVWQIATRAGGPCDRLRIFNKDTGVMTHEFPHPLVSWEGGSFIDAFSDILYVNNYVYIANCGDTINQFPVIYKIDPVTRIVTTYKRIAPAEITGDNVASTIDFLLCLAVDDSTPSAPILYATFYSDYTDFYFDGTNYLHYFVTSKNYIVTLDKDLNILATSDSPVTTGEGVDANVSAHPYVRSGTSTILSQQFFFSPNITTKTFKIYVDNIENGNGTVGAISSVTMNTNQVLKFTYTAPTVGAGLTEDHTILFVPDHIPDVTNLHYVVTTVGSGAEQSWMTTFTPTDCDLLFGGDTQTFYIDWFAVAPPANYNTTWYTKLNSGSYVSGGNANTGTWTPSLSTDGTSLEHSVFTPPASNTIDTNHGSKMVVTGGQTYSNDATPNIVDKITAAFPTEGGMVGTYFALFYNGYLYVLNPRNNQNSGTIIHNSILFKLQWGGSSWSLVDSIKLADPVIGYAYDQGSKLWFSHKNMSTNKVDNISAIDLSTFSVTNTNSYDYGSDSSTVKLAYSDIAKKGYYTFDETVTSSSPLNITTVTLPSVCDNSSYSSSIEATGGTAPYTWSITTGALPTGLNLNTSTGAITGTATATGIFNFIAQVEDSVAATDTKALSITVWENPSITTTTLAPGNLTVSYSQSLYGTGGSTPYTWSLVIIDGDLPPGLVLHADTGIIDGTPTLIGTYNFRILLTDNNGCTTSKALSIWVRGLPPAPGGTFPDICEYSNYFYQIPVDNGVKPFTFSITDGKLPNSLNLAQDTGQVQGISTESGIFLFTVTVVDDEGSVGSNDYSITVHGTPVIMTNSQLPPAVISKPYSLTFSQIGGDLPITWNIVVTQFSGWPLPNGLTFNPIYGTISGIPLESGNFSFITTAMTNNQCIASKRFYLTVMSGPTFMPPDLTGNMSPACQNHDYSYYIVVENGLPPYYWFLDYSSDSMPQGLILDPYTGQISGIPTIAGTYYLIIKVTDQNKLYNSKKFRLIVQPEEICGASYDTTLQVTKDRLASLESEKIVVQDPFHQDNLFNYLPLPFNEDK